jgi:hypothetical protein
MVYLAKHRLTAPQLRGGEMQRPDVELQQSAEYARILARRAEFERLTLQARQRKPLLIFGPEGVGKIRLLREFVQTQPLALYHADLLSARYVALAHGWSPQNTWSTKPSAEYINDEHHLLEGGCESSSGYQTIPADCGSHRWTIARCYQAHQGAWLLRKNADFSGSSLFAHGRYWRVATPICWQK